MRALAYILCVTVIGLHTSCSAPGPSPAEQEAVAAAKKQQEPRPEILQYGQEIEQLFRQCNAVFTGLRLGMKARDIQAQIQQPHGRCAKVHSTQTAQGIREEWVWGDGSGRAVYFDNGVLSAIHQ